MAQFKYKAVDKSGVLAKGRTQAANLLDLEHRLMQQGQDLITCEEIKSNGMFRGRHKLTRRDVINMVFQLEQLTKSGVPLLEGLADLRDSTVAGYYHDVLASLVESIEGGKTFSAALADFPQDFDTVFIALIAVGEETGELPKILKDMGETLRWTDELIAATVKIIIYPAIVAVVVFAVAAFLMIYLVPKIVPFVKEMGAEVPIHTLALIAVSDFFIHYWWLLILLPAALTAVFKAAVKKSPALRLKFDGIKLRLPIFGQISFKIKLARFASYMALLYASGITVLRALEICQALVDNTVMAAAIERAGRSIAEGSSISESFARLGLFPPLVVRMLKVGEHTGNLDEALLNVSYFYNREVQEAIATIEPAISPILTVVMGTLLGWIMLSVLGPVWDAVSKAG
ncbi:MAG TPA: type II secretion system F family protein [Cellvibrionaceae bacterium]